MRPSASKRQTGHRGPTFSGPDCPDENTFVDLLEGRLARAERQALERHLDACTECRKLVAAAARSRPSNA
jgi:hypothetical protein